jgi:AmmeMemoRadiSam system protein A
MTQINPAPNKEDLPLLSDENKKYLLSVARDTINRYIKGEPPATLKYDDPALKEEWGAFVTLKIDGELRGCIGSIGSYDPLPETVAELAIKSATSDPRFPPLSPSELDHIDLEISVLGPLEEVSDISEIVIGRDGLEIEYRGRRGLLLPQVATEYNLDVLSFLAQTCLKAGLPPDAWKFGAKIYKFPAVVF